MTDSVYTFRSYDLEYYPQPNNTYWGICRELGIRLREKDLETLKSKFHEQVKSIKYRIYLLWSCDQEDYYCTNSEQYGIENLLESLPQLKERIEEIERRNTILNIEVKKL